MKFIISILLLFTTLFTYSQENEDKIIDGSSYYKYINVDSARLNKIKIVERFGAGGVYLDSTGMTLKGNATVIDDIIVPATQTRVGANNLPVFNTTELALDFVPDLDSSEIVYQIYQFPHRWDDSTSFNMHFHWKQKASGDTFTMRMAYKLMPIGGVEGTWNYVTATNKEFSYSSGTLHQIGYFPPILFNGKESSIAEVKFYRVDSGGTAHIYVMSFDPHIVINKLGTNNEY